MSQRIIVKVAPNGETEVRTEGFAGSACQKASRFIEQALGSKQTERLTQDYFNISTDAGNQQLNQGAGQ